MSVFMPVVRCSIVILSEVWEDYASCFFSPCIALAFLGLLWFHVNVSYLFCSVKNVMGSLIGITLNQQIG